MIATLSPRELWIQALRSGKYKQGYYVLANRGKFCCLGVACEVYQEHVGGLEIKINAEGQKSYNEQTKLLPLVVQEWLGLKDYCSIRLPELNDVDLLNFNKIADYLESPTCGIFYDPVRT